MILENIIFAIALIVLILIGIASIVIGTKLKKSDYKDMIGYKQSNSLRAITDTFGGLYLPFWKFGFIASGITAILLGLMFFLILFSIL